MASILRQRRDTEANWTANDPVIPDGQLCFDTTNNTFRIGNGVDMYSALPILSGTPGTGGQVNDVIGGSDILVDSTDPTSPIVSLDPSNVVKKTTSNTFTAPQIYEVTTNNGLAFDLSVTNNFSCTPTSNGTIDFTNIVSGQSGNILLNNTGGYTISKNSSVKCDSNFLADISAAGTYWVSYMSSVQSSAPISFNKPANQIETLTGETSAERIVYCDNGKYICGTEGNAKIYTSSDYGATWTDRGGLGSGATVVFGLKYLENGIALAGTSPNGDLFRTTDYGATWSLISYGKTAKAHDLRGIAYAGSGVVCIGNQQVDGADLTRGSKFYRSTDYGLNWTEVFYSNDTEGMFGCYTMDYVGNNNFVAMIGNGGNGGPYTDQGHIIHSSDNGLTWTTVESNIDSYAAYCSANDGSGTCYMPFSGGGQPFDADSLIIFKSTDYGATWARITQFFTNTGALNGLTYLGDNTWLIGTDDTGGAGNDGCSVYASFDGCESWTKEYDLAGADSDSRTYAIAKDENNNLLFGTYKITGTGKLWRASYTPSSGGPKVYVVTSGELS